jgi:hypothetical protein
MPYITQEEELDTDEESDSESESDEESERNKTQIKTKESWIPSLKGIDVNWLLVLIIVLSIPALLVPQKYTQDEKNIYEIIVRRIGNWDGWIEIECSTSDYTFKEIMLQGQNEINCRPLDANTTHTITAIAVEWRSTNNSGPILRNIHGIETRIVKTFPDLEDREEANNWMKLIEEGETSMPRPTVTIIDHIRVEGRGTNIRMFGRPYGSESYITIIGKSSDKRTAFRGELNKGNHKAEWTGLKPFLWHTITFRRWGRRLNKTGNTVWKNTKNHTVTLLAWNEDVITPRSQKRDVRQRYHEKT